MSDLSGTREELRGELVVLAVDSSRDSDLEYLLNEGGLEMRALRFNGEEPPGEEFRSGVTLVASGLQQSDGTFLVESAEAIEGMAQASSALGPQSTAVILIDLQDKALPYSPALARSKVFEDADAFLRDSSSGATWLSGDVMGPFSIPSSTSSCEPFRIADQADAMARQAGWDLSAYRRLMYVIPANSSCAWLGLGTVGGNPSRAWLNGTLSLHTVTHELGHNFGLRHANAWDCGSQSIASKCHAIEYGDPSSTMGMYFATQFNTVEKERLGWIGRSGTPLIQVAHIDGTYAIESSRASSGGAKALKILRQVEASTGARSYYYLEYRQPTGFDEILGRLGLSSNLVRGVQVRVAAESGSLGSLLLHAQPSRQSWFESAFEPAGSFNDPERNIRVEVLSVSDTGARVLVSTGNPTVSGCLQNDP